MTGMLVRMRINLMRMVRRVERVYFVSYERTHIFLQLLCYSFIIASSTLNKDIAMHLASKAEILV